jgi:thiamine kinase-like enzyme
MPRVADALRRLHTLTPPFAADKTVFSILDDCLGLVREQRIEVPPGCLDHLPTVARIRTALMTQTLPFAPCNNDVYAPNFIDQHGTVRIIDYDYSGMNDPCFDLGDLAAEGGFTPDQVEALCESYFRARRPVQVARARLFGTVAQFTWTVLMAAADQTIEAKPDPCYDYGAEGLTRWAEVLPQLESPELDTLLAQAQRDE